MSVFLKNILWNQFSKFNILMSLLITLKKLLWKKHHSYNTGCFLILFLYFLDTVIITNCPQTSNQFESIWHFNISRIITFSYCLWSSQDKNTEVVCHSLLQWNTFCQISPPWSAHLGLPHGHGLVHWVRQGCGPSVIRLTSFPWVWFQCVCPLMPSCNTYHLTWVSLTLGVGYL